MMSKKIISKNAISIMIIFITITILSVTLMGSSNAFNGGPGDQDSECIGCHGPGGNAVLSINAPSTPIEAGSEGVLISIDVNIDNADSDSMLAGVMLLDGNDLNPSASGWIITSDPNDNSQNYNFNQMSATSGNTAFEWTLSAPDDPGTYGLKARLFYDDGGSYYLETDQLNFTVTDAVPDSSGTTDEVSTDDNTTTDNGLNTDNSNQPIPVNTRGLALGVLVGLCSFMIISILRRRYYE